jgi:hypothetical protein
MKWRLLGLGIFMMVASLGLAVASFVFGMKNGHVVCCHIDMGITSELSEALDQLGVTDEELAGYLAQHNQRFSSAGDSHQSRESMVWRMAVLLTPDARDLYTEKVTDGTNLGLMGSGIAAMGGTLLLLASRSDARARRELDAARTEQSSSESR